MRHFTHYESAAILHSVSDISNKRMVTIHYNITSPSAGIHTELGWQCGSEAHR